MTGEPGPMHRDALTRISPITEELHGACLVPMTRAVVRYREDQVLHPGGARADDIGMALVLDGSVVAACDSVELGSGRRFMLDLSRDLVVLEWAAEDVQARLRHALDTEGVDEEARTLGFELGRATLERVGFTALTRPILLRIGFRDVCRDLDPHEGSTVRFLLGPGRVVYTHLEAEECALVLECASACGDRPLEAALLEHGKAPEVRRILVERRGSGVSYRVLFDPPTSFAEVRTRLLAVRRILRRLSAGFEPERHRTVARLLDVFGERETLARLRLGDRAKGASTTALDLHAAPALAGAAVH